MCYTMYIKVSGISARTNGHGMAYIPTLQKAERNIKHPCTLVCLPGLHIPGVGVDVKPKTKRQTLSTISFCQTKTMVMTQNMIQMEVSPFPR